LGDAIQMENNNATQNVTRVKKKKFDVDQFMQQWNTLDPQNYGGWPYAIKITIWIFIILLICIMGYLILIQPKIEEIENARGQEANLLEEFRKKESKLRNLEQYQKQLHSIQENFNQQLEQLPKETEISGLVEDINITGVNAGLKFKHILLEPEIKQEFMIEQPISIEATGDYHAFGSFVSAIALLPRIVTLHDFTVTAGQNPKQMAGIPLITYAIKAKTYRYVGDTPKLNAEKQEAKK
jgi:type IV pilus assembly protein PilO